MSIQDSVLRALAQEAEMGVAEFWESDYAAKCGSEIERAFAATYMLRLSLRASTQVTYSLEACGKFGADQFLEPQFQIGQYRVDFLLGSKWAEGNLLKCVAIECDGHDFHEKTKEQAARDKTRDRYLSANVGRVLRFTGSEIFRDPGACADEAFNIMSIAHLGFDPSKL